MTDIHIRPNIDEARRELLDLTLRNPLLNYRTTKARGVDMVGESAEQVFDMLVTQSRAMSFLADDTSNNVTELWGEELDWTEGPSYSADQTDRRLQTRETSENLQKRLLNTYRLANTTIEETGVNTLFMALGMLRWFESDQSQEERRAPLVLVPVKLERGGVRERFGVQYTGDDIGTNLSLVEKVHNDHGFWLPGQEDMNNVADGSIQVTDFLDLVFDSVKKFGLNRWRVDREAVTLGFFSYNKILMYLDLDDSEWPSGEGIAENEIIDALFQDGFAEPDATIRGEDNLDSQLTPQDTYHVLDADASQSLAIHDASDGRNLVIQGPPGTGKSQTIANIIAQAVGRGKRVLFVAEKMAALDVVKRRLDNIGLGDTCLELHSNKTNKRGTLDSLGKALNIEEPARGGINSTLDNLERTRSQLNDYSDAVNTPIGQSGVSPYTAFGYLLGTKPTMGHDSTSNPISWQHISGPSKKILSWTDADFQRKREVVEELRLRLQQVDIPSQHPFWGSRLRTLTPAGQAALREKITAAAVAWDALIAKSDALSDVLQLNRPTTTSEAESLLSTTGCIASAPNLQGLNLATSQWQSQADQIRALVALGFRWKLLHSEHDQYLLPKAWDADLGQVRQILNTTGRSFFGRLFSSGYKRSRRQFASQLKVVFPRDVNLQLKLIDAIHEEQQIRAELNTDQPSDEYRDAAFALGGHWAGHSTDWYTVAPLVDWWLNLWNDIAEGRATADVATVLQNQPNASQQRTKLTEAIHEVRRALDDCIDRVGELESGLDLDNEGRFGDAMGIISQGFSHGRHTLDEWDKRLDDIHDFIGFSNGAEAVLLEDLRPVVTVAQQVPNASVSLTEWFERAWYESIIETAMAERPALRQFDGRVHEDRIQRFKNLDQESLYLNRTRVSLTHWEGLARVNNLPPNLTRVTAADQASTDQGEPDAVQERRLQEELRFFKREMAKKTRHKSIRQLIKQAGEVIQELKPVFMMSPLSIATYLEPGSVNFDLTIFDEASQVRPVDAFGALLRSHKAVVVGDSRQLPPTRFFDRVYQSDGEDDEDESVVAGMESILDLFVSQGAPERRLRWHYRSRHESLIAVSNREFYANDLVVFPSPETGRGSSGLQMHHLPDTVFDRGKSTVNRQEADAVAKAVMEHAVSRRELSLGVAAFSQAQAQAILDRLEILRRQDDSGEEFLASHTEEPFFVKNLENVQGDERDVIYISVGYGRDENRRLTMNFGPLNQEGGERRLNVLITRAKMQCHVFTNLLSQDIDLSKTASFGVRALKSFLAYAETGVMPPDLPYESSFEVDSPFQQAVGRRLEELGYLVHREVATAGKFIDIGIVDQERPGRYIIGIECDGASYHSSRSARDRDRLREQVLQGLGWKLHRIWSSDWFRNPERELDRAVEAIERAKSYPSTTQSPDFTSN